MDLHSSFLRDLDQPVCRVWHKIMAEHMQAWKFDWVSRNEVAACRASS
jgi:hypothetical protein